MSRRERWNYSISTSHFHSTNKSHSSTISIRRESRSYPPQRAKARRSGGREGEGSNMQMITRVRVQPNPNEVDHQQHTVQVPAHMARGGAEILISPQPDGRTRLMSLIPVEDERQGMQREKMVGGAPAMKKRKEEDDQQGGEGERGEGGEREGEDEEEGDTSDMPLLEADKEALEKRKEARNRQNGEWNGMEEEVDVENVEDADKMRMEDDEMEMEGEVEGEIPLLTSQVRRRQGLFFVPELDGYYSEQRYQMCAPKMKGGLRLCESCNVYMRKSVFYHHQRTIREHGSCSAMTPKRFECGVPECEDKMPTIERLCVHMAEEHGMPTDVQETEFMNEDEFQAFLVELESKGGNFRMSRGNKCGKSGVVRYYRCNRVSNTGKFRGRRPKTLKDADPNAPPSEMEAEVEEEIELESGVRGKKAALVRTEKICTAFYRKAESIDGRISVRYCDFHLHEDIKVKLPDAVKERIMDMLSKKLPMPVIVEVVKAESEEFARVGSELERRIYSITEKDVRNVYCTYLAKRRKEERTGMEEVPELNEMEQRFLMAFEKAEGKSIHEVAKGSKVTLERRRRRDALRERVNGLQRFFKSDKFVEFSDAKLLSMEELFGELHELCATPCNNGAAKMDVMEDILEEEDIEEEEEDRRRGEGRGGGGE
ncbi:hypothetical protein PFISCL1PPCAC_29079, partial [Pristionchus fissidentatus]